MAPDGLFRVRLAGGSYRLAAGTPEEGPRWMLDPELSLDRSLREQADLGEVVAARTDEPIPSGSSVVAPVESQEVWGAGVTYRRSREARAEEALDRTPYDLVYTAERPELFFKSPGWRAVGPGDAIGIRRDSTWDVPEAELTLVVDAGMRIAGFTIGNDVSSRSIEGQNALYLPQAKTYERSCALGPCIVPVDAVSGPHRIVMEIERDGAIAFTGDVSTSEMRRSFDELTRFLGSAIAFPDGVMLLTGTGIIPDGNFTLRAGDLVRISIEGLGTLENPVVRVG